MPLLSVLLQELRYTARTLRREPLFAFGVIATFALSIGTNAAMFGLVSRLLIAPPPGVHAPERVARVQIERGGPNGERFAMSSMSYPMFEALRAQQRAFNAVAALRTDTVVVGRGEQLAQAGVVQATGDYFRVLGAAPALGRFFGPADDELPLGNLVVVLSHAYWQAHYAGQTSVLGQEIIIDDQRYTIIGVAQPGFNGDRLARVDLFLPLSAALRHHDYGWWANEHVNMVFAIARLRPDVNATVATQLATSALPRSAPHDADAAVLLEPVQPGSSARATPQGRIALWLTGVSLIVLLIATANVGTLLLLRAARRRRDFAVRVALGAGRAQLARQLIMESVLLALLGGAAGLLLSRWFGTLLRSTLWPSLPAEEGFTDARVLLASVLVAALAGVLAGLAPLRQLKRANITDDLRGSRLAFQNVLVGMQVALCTVLLIGAGLFVRSLERVQAQDLGFQTSDLLFVTLDFRISLPGSERDAVHEDAVRRVRGVLGVSRATAVQAMPFGAFHVPPLSVPGLAEMPTIDGQPPFMYGASLDYLQMMRVRALQGRLFDERDTRNGPLVVLVNESMARHLWPGQPALGKCIRAGYGAGVPLGFGAGNPAATAPCREVVGVVRDSRARSLRPDGNEAKFMQFYVPFEQLPRPPAPNYFAINGLLVQVAANAEGVSAAVQRAIQTGSNVPLYARVRPYQELLDPQLRSWRLGASLFSVFSFLALAIAAVGLFGVVSYSVAQRTRELGVRIALGASRALLWRLVVLRAVALVGIGLGAGTIAALAAGPAIRGLLFQTQPWEPANLAAAALTLLAVTVIAALWPAWRAGRVNPMVTLRTD